jgi:RHS repeat-associated protein
MSVARDAAVLCRRVFAMVFTAVSSGPASAVGTFALLSLFVVLPLSAGRAGADTPSAGPQKGAVEIPARRTASSDTFRNPDGTDTTVVYSGSVNYQASDGSWQPINSQLIPSDRAGYAYRNNANRFHVYFKPQLDNDFLRFEVDGKSFTLSAQGASAHAASVGGSHADYGNALSGAGLRYQVVADGVKESITIPDSGSPSHYRFILSGPATADINAVPEPDGSWAFFMPPKGEPIFTLAPPVAADAPASTANGTATPPTTTTTTSQTTTDSTTTSSTTTDAVTTDASTTTNAATTNSAASANTSTTTNASVTSAAATTTPVATTNPTTTIASQTTAAPATTAETTTSTPTTTPAPTTSATTTAPSATTTDTPPATTTTNSAPSKATAPADGNSPAPAARRHASLDVQKQGDRFSLDLSVDPQWLHSADRRFPVTLDPTITIQPPVDDASFATSCANCTPYTSDGLLYVGTDTSNVWRAALRFDLSAIPPGSAVTSAQLKTYFNGSCMSNAAGAWSCNVSHQIDAHRMTTAWSDTSQSSQIQFDPSTLSSFTLPANPSNTWMTWDVTQTAKDWLTQAQPNYGLLLMRSPDSTLGVGGPAVPGSRYTGDPSVRPELSVTYTSDAVDLLPPDTLHSNGADLSWSRYSGPSGAPFQKYEVHRGASAGFTPTASNLIATITDVNQTTYRDTTAAPGKTLTYKIVANSSASNEETVSLPADGLATKALQPDPTAGESTYLFYYTGYQNCANYGAKPDLRAGTSSTDIYRSLVSFDLRDVPSGATISNATLSLFENYAPTIGMTVEAHRVTGGWTEGTGQATCTGDGATWYERQGGVPWTANGGDVDPTVLSSVSRTANSSTQWDNFNITPAAQQWANGTAPNLGIMLKSTDESFVSGKFLTWNSDDFSVAPTLRPKLSVTYADGSHAIPPSVSLSAPAASATVNGTVSLTAGASDDSRVDHVDFAVDGAVVGTASTAPYSYNWNSSSVGNGQHTVTAIATDDAGNQTTSSGVAISVQNFAAPTITITAPAANATVTGTSTVSASVSAPAGVDHVEFYLDGNRLPGAVSNPSSGNYSISWNTLDASLPAYDGQHSLTAAVYDSASRSATTSGTTVSVVNTTGTQYRAAITSSAEPQAVQYDPSAGTQQTYGINVSLTNNSTTSWSSSSVYLRYEWLAPDGTTTASGNLALPGSIAKGRSTSVQVLVPAPAMPAGVLRQEDTLRFDLYDTAAATYFASKGNPPLDNPVIVNKLLTTSALGLERYYHYVGQDVGGGMQQLTNVANGNSLLRWTPFGEPGRGLATVVDLTYNSLEEHSDSPAGANWSIAISGLTRLGLPLDIHPNNADSIAGRSNRFVELIDGDGTKLRFTSTDGVYWVAPAGVHLYLRSTTSGWALTRPDGVTFNYDTNGYPTSVQNRNGNTVTFTESTVQPGDDPGGPKQHVTQVTDAGGRNFTITYFTKADAKKPQVRGKIKQISDHLGRKLDFAYYDDGNLLSLTEEGGSNADGSALAPRSWTFTYASSAGSGPAIATASARLSPDPKTPNESTRLYSVIDPRGHETTFAYVTSGQDKWKLTSITDRKGNVSSFSYDDTNQQTTVTRPLSRSWNYNYDSAGRVTSIRNPLNQQESVSWTSDNEVQQVAEPSGATRSYTYNANGYLTSSTDQLSNKTTLAYQNLAVDSNDSATHWESGRTVPHESQLQTLTKPKGVAAGSGYQTTFAYDSNGNPTSVTDANGGQTINTYNADGTLASSKDRDGHTTAFSSYDANGLPQTQTDPLGNVTSYGYDAAGDLLFIQDANHQTDPSTGQPWGASVDAHTYRDQFYYDSWGRLERQSAPKSSQYDPGNLIWTDASYDANDNLVSQMAPHYGTSDGQNGSVTTTSYDELDRTTQVTGPDKSVDPAGERTKYSYDAAGRITQVQSPNGVQSGVSNAWSTSYAYDLLDRVTSTTQYGADGSTTRVTHLCYDLAGDLRSRTLPNGNATFTACPSATTPYTPSSDPYTQLLSYNAAHELTSQTDPAGHKQSRTYDADGNVGTQTDANGNTTTLSYDQLDRLIKQVQPLDTSVSPERDLTTQWQYDAAGNLKKLISPRAYDASADKQTFTDYVTTYQYDANNQLVRADLPTAGGSQQLYQYRSYDANGNLLASTLPTSTAMAVGSIDLSQIGADQKTTTSFFDPGWIRTSNNPSDPPVNFDYTAEGWQSRRTPDSVGTTTPDANKQMDWTYTPDGLTARVTAPDPKGGFSTYSYDANGNLTQAAEGRGVYDPSEATTNATIAYDGFGEPTRVSDKRANASVYTVSTFGYDGDGNVTARLDNGTSNSPTDTVSGGDSQTFAYDGADWLKTETDSGQDQLIRESFTPAGQPSTREIDNAAGSTVKQTTTWTYYANKLLKTLTTKNGSGTTLQSHNLSYLSSSGNYINGNRTSDQFTLQQPTTTRCPVASPCTATYSYDPLDRLTAYDNGHGSTSSYTLDPAGNITQQTTAGATTSFTYTGTRLATETPPGAPKTDFFYNDNGDLLCQTTDPGTKADCPVSAGGTPASDVVASYSWDPLDRLSAVHSYSSGTTPVLNSSYVYDALNRTSSETQQHGTSTATTTNFSYLGVTNDLTKQQASGGTTKTFNYDGNGIRVGMTNTTAGGAATSYSYGYDPSGNVSQLISAGSATASYGYDPYGTPDQTLTQGDPQPPANDPTQPLNPFRYSGRYFDTGSGTLDMGARRFGPDTAHFLQEDQYAGALDNLGLATDPLSQNRYDLAGGNPINFVETDGHMVEASGGGGAGPAPQPTHHSSGILGTISGGLSWAYHSSGAASDVNTTVSAAKGAYHFTKETIWDRNNPCAAVNIGNAADDWTCTKAMGASFRDQGTQIGKDLWSNDPKRNARGLANVCLLLCTLPFGGEGDAAEGGIAGSRAAVATGDAAEHGIPAGSSADAATSGGRITQALRNKYFGEGSEPPTCSYCQQNPAEHLDHVIPRSQGGDLTSENLTPACSWCNLSKGDRVAPVNPPPGYVGEWPPSFWPSRMTDWWNLTYSGKP